ncbi:Phosphatidylinositol-specific phospholipase [Cordyceps fumosorosea ARSEF 2679]|uniref:Phosphatidylinositol-specific phospholipase n=1 Tax=Cordyceps fumosorosea (strain ARSEF 2679) TaxID=1081104 RepID=A0A167R724_CORFA|nr:Phosphatidylinositol-specific phospholipase [Cordyceps fumosorosea ARSEF 2679]OAA58332.1 Phosphatidylinositol-specific phospholipase [Cordyceps fumosorosea ARSEF 2679]
MVSNSNSRPSPDRPSRLSTSSLSSPSSSSPPSSPLLGKSSPDVAAPFGRSRSPISYLFWLAVTFLSAMLLLRTFFAAAAPCIVAAACYHGFNSPFSFDAGALAHPSWMGALRNDTLLTSLSVPGTHDTMTYAIGSEVLQCQNANLSTQLAAGLRYFDVRARLRDNELHIYHGDGDTGFSYQDVLLNMFNFLEAHPSETLVIRVKQEGTPIGEHNTRTFEEAFNYYRYQSALTAKQAYRYFYKWDPAAPLPTLGDLRSKILVLQNFPADGNGPANKYGIAWEGNQMVLEDLWEIPDVNHLSDKWNAIRDALTKTASDPQDNKALYLSHISASVGVLPIEAAAGPKNRTVVGMNDETGRWLEAGDQNGRTGIVIFDFPGKRGIEAVLARNDVFKA